MPAGTVISGTDGRVELRTEAGSAIGELPRVKSWSLEATAAVSERGGRVMASNDDGVPTAARQTVTLADVPEQDDTVTIGGVTFTFKPDGGASGNFEIAPQLPVASASNNAAALALAILSYHPTVTATAAAGVVTIVARETGIDGNRITLAKSGTDISVGGNTLVGGIDGNGPWTARRAISRSWSGSVEFEWQESQSIPASLQVDPSKVGQTIQVKFYPHDDASGRVVYSGIARIAGVSQPAEVDGNLMASVDFTGNGALTYDTVS